ncbi:hypothetical protein G6N82_13985 [Altererythrobacter sp. BO-6]|uniref:DUF5801 repeats-in-toxin domain-containing protein n=1 Tax=Altererythrobacter sp. BO-6 TaxID=2604537 RepID=UPI0013E1D897|nr:DUF5801 repeats-in-toxin domain-containing protein [Altererythrobacter sp. BO-6]QIG55107.1 hypothetical protein G6N82_13985 [Altererythrobacter sp. BO-6]
MVDFEGGKRGGFERDDSINDAVQPGSNGYQDSPASASAGTRILVADANGVVTLPAGTTLDNFAVVGRDLVITLADGSTIIIPDGAINTPQIVIDGTALSPLVVSAALNGLPLSPDEEGFNPEDLPGAPPSSGGDFEDSQLNLQDAFDLGDLLPYTELFYEPQPDEEIIPFDNNEPDVVIETPDNPVGVENAIATVAERGLPERGEEPEGTADETNAETTTGTIVFNSPDGISAIILNGVEITSVGQQFTTPFGTLTITSINLAAGEIGFSYTLADNLLGETEDGNFFVTVVDRDGDTASASLKILVEDDSPIAADDIGIVPSGSHAPIGGNVLVNDESGADDYPVGEGGLEAVVSFAKGATTAQPGETIQGTYGKLTLNADGTYTYVRDFNTPGGVSESFTYTITDQDGSRDTATLTINIEDAGNNIELPKIGDGTVVNESGLPERGDPLEPEGTDETADTETTSGTITFNSPDGVQSVTVNGVAITPGSLPQTIVDNATGTLVITGYTYDPVTGDGTITYEYTLGDNTSGDDTSVSFEVVVTDLDGDKADDDLVITIIDDEPEAKDDFDSVTEDGPAVANGNVLTGVGGDDANATDGVADIEGADGASVTGVVAGDVDGPVSGGLGQTVPGKYGTLTVDADGNYTYTLYTQEQNPDAYALVQGLDSNDIFTDEVFSYTITDGDSDTSTAQLRIQVNGADDPVVIEGLDLDAPEVTVDEDDLPLGTDTTKEPLTQPVPDGAFTFKSVDGLVTLKIGSETFTAAQLLDSSTFPTTITGDYGTLTIQSVTLQQAPDGSIIGGTVTYDYTLGTNTLDHDDAGEDDVFDRFAVEIEDTDGSVDDASLDVRVIDDVPLTGENAPVALDDDALGGNPGGTGDTDPDSANLTGILAHQFGADGASSITFAAMNGQTVDINGVTVTFNWAGDTLIANDGTNDVFTVQVNPATGAYTVTQLAPLNHHASGDDVEAGATFNLTYTVTDGDTDTATGTLTINLNDDTPEFGEQAEPAPTLVTDDTLVGDNGSDSDSANFAAAFAPLYGADGQASTDPIVYSFGLKDGNGTDSGLNDTASGDDILLRVNGNVVEGYLANSPTTIAFTLTLDPATGDVTQTQLRAIEHDDPADALEEGANAESMVPDVISLTAEITDGDGDQASQSIDIGDAFTFTDDGPQVGEQNTASVAVDEDSLGSGNGDNAAGDDAGGDSAAIVFAVDFGADGKNADELTVSVASVTTADPSLGPIALTSGGVAVLYDWNAATNTLTGYTTDINDPVFTLVFDVDAGTASFTLLGALDHPSTDADGANDGPEIGYEDNLVLNLSIVAKDGDGDTVSSQLAISIDDDMAVAVADDDTVGEGESTGGNVVTDDSAGADGYADNGPVVDAAFVSADQGVTFVSKTVAPDGTITIVTSAGTLTLATDGTYAFDSLTNSVDGDAEIVFSYTIEDGDGDRATANLTIDVTNVGGSATVDALTVDEKGLADGTGELANPALNSDQSEVASGQIVVSGASGSATLTYQLVGGTFNDNGTPGDASDDTYTLTTAYGTIVLQAATGAYTYTLNEEFDHSAGGGRNTAPDVESFDYVVVDEFANVIVDSRNPGGNPIEVSIVDDIPVVAIQLDANADVTLDESGDGAGAATINTGSIVKGNDPDVAGDGAISRATSGTAVVTFAAGNPVYGADGQGPAPVYSLQIDTAALSDVTLTDGSTITLQMVGDVIVGVVDNGPFAGQAAFAIAINSGTGVVTVEQYLSLQHPLNPNQDEPIDLDDGAISVVVTVEDFDGDQVESNAIDISANIVFEDDGPSVTALNIDNNSVVAITSDADIVDTDSMSLVALFVSAADYGADGEGSAVIETYGIDLLGDTDLGDATVGINSGFTSGNATVYLYQDGNSVVASTAATKGDVDFGTNVVFVAAVNPTTGQLTLEQSGVLDHTDNGSATDTQLVLANGLINATYSVTITDGDNDPVSDTQTADLGGNLKFNDDLPTPQNATVNVQVDEDELNGGNTDGDGVDTEESGSLNALVDFGNDTPGSFAFNLAGFTDPNLTSGGVTVNWGIDASGKLVGYTGANITDASSHVIVVELVNTGGNWSVKVSLKDQVDHLPNDPANNDNQTLSFNIGGAIVATDFDGDEITLSNNAVSVTVEDDIPTFGANTNTVDTLVTDDTLITDSASASFASLFTPLYGADGAAAVDAITYALSINGVNGTDSGLDDAVTGQNILLRLVGTDTIEGYLAGSPTTVAFTITVDANGTVELTQERAIKHDDATDPDETFANGDAETMAADLIRISATITDGDEDSVTSAPVNIGDKFAFEDDGPSTGSNAMVQLDDDDFGSDGNPGGDGDVASSLVLTGTLAHDFGADGAGTITLASMNGQSVIVNGVTVTFTWAGNTLTANDGDNDVFSVTVNPTTGEYTVTQLGVLDHHLVGDQTESNPAFDLTYTVTDADGDTKTGTFTVKVNDDTPEATDDVFNQADQGGENTAVTGNVGTNDSAGADGLGAYTYNDDHNGLGILDFNSATGAFTYTPAAGEEGMVTFTYTLTDGDGDAVTKQVTINLVDDSDPFAPNHVTAVDDDGLANANLTGSPSDDINANGGDLNAGQPGDTEAITIGNLNGSFGNDTPGSYSFADGSGTLGTEAISWTWNDATDTLTATSSRGTIFTIVVDQATGNYTMTLLQNVLHPEPTSDADNGERAVSLNLTYNAIDSENEVSPDATVTIIFGDDGPTFASNSTAAPDLVTDDTDITDSASASFASLFTPVYGADGAAASAAIVYTLGLGGAASGLTDSITDQSILLRVKAGDPNTIEGYLQTDGDVAFTISVDPTTGIVTLTQLRAIEHDNTADPAETFLSGEAETMAAGLITLTAKITDGDGDYASQTVNIGDSFHFEDDGPTFTSKTAAILDDSASPTGTGTFVYDIGSDNPTGIEVVLNSFTGAVGGLAIQPTGVALNDADPNDGIDTYDISFTYAPNPDEPGTTVAATGTVSFNTNSGQWTVTLDAPIQSYSLTSVFGDTTITYLNSDTNPYGGASQWEVANVAFNGDPFYVQFTGREAPLALSSGEFTGNESWVQLSSANTGVAGNSIQQGEVIDFNFYNADPGNIAGEDPTAAATGFYIQIDQFNSGSEDFIVVLKLALPGDIPGTLTTVALKIDSNDVLTTNQAGYPTLTGANQGLIVIEAADYAHLVPAGYQIVGAQFLTSAQGITLTAYEFNGAVGSAATDTTGTVYSGPSVLTDNDVVKITDIGIQRITETSEALTLNLNVTVTDADGDSFNQTLVVNPVVPVVLDLDGGGNGFTPLSSGLAYDYNGDGVKTQTAWVAAGSAILAYDMNGDGIVNDASEFVFGGGDMTDLEAIAAKYDENGDNVLDASDSAYGKFGVWMDDGDAVFEAGEFQTLEQAGIKSIDLVSDGIQTSEADGDVTVFGTASFTWMDGSTGAVSDAAFATGSDVDPAMMDALLALEPTAEPSGTQLADASDGDIGEGLPQLAAIVDDVMAESSIDLMIDNLAGDNADIVGNSGESSYLDGGALAQMIEAGAFAFHGNNAMADTHEDAAVLAAINA